MPSYQPPASTDELVKANVAQLTRLVARLGSRAARSSWQEYRSTCSYDEVDASQKDDFVRGAVGRRRRRLTWDLGCNDGRFARIAAAVGSTTTVAVDSEPVVIDRLYSALRDEGTETVLPLVVDLANPSPGLGWRNAERGTLLDRGAPDLVLCLALVHHLSISRNVPLREVVAWLRSLECGIVVEFPHRSDPMVETLLRHKAKDGHPDYQRETFESLLASDFAIVDSLELASGTRTLYAARPE